MAAHFWAMKPKTVFKSKIAMLGAATALVGGLGMVDETVRQMITSNGPAILLVLGVLNTALRFVTKGRVSLFPD